MSEITPTIVLAHSDWEKYEPLEDAIQDQLEGVVTIPAYGFKSAEECIFQFKDQLVAVVSALTPTVEDKNPNNAVSRAVTYNTSTANRRKIPTISISDDPFDSFEEDHLPIGSQKFRRKEPLEVVLAAIAAAAKVDYIQKPEPYLGKGRILALDYHNRARRVLTKHAAANFPNCEVVADMSHKDQALARIAKIATPISLVVTGIRLPQFGDGNDVVEAAEQLGIPTIMYTGSPQEVSAEVRAQCFSLLDKPVYGDTLLAAIRAGLREFDRRKSV